MLPFIQKQTSRLFPDKSFEITLSDDGEQLKFYYPSLTGSSQLYLRDHVLIEFGMRNTTEPCDNHKIISYAEETNVALLEFPRAIVKTLSPIRTFWEKATLIHVECHRDRMEKTPERLSRH